jgi:hypothetical protein
VYVPILGLLALLAFWYAVVEIVCYTTGMHTLKIAAMAALGACLPFVPELVALTPFPAPVANALCAAILAAAYAVVPKAKESAK